MTPFKLDTSGAVPSTFHEPDYTWDRLSPFVQGYVEEALEDLNRRFFSSGGYTEADFIGFRHLAPETLARIVEDCAVFFGVGGPWFPVGDYETGKQFWRTRQKGQWAYMGFPSLTLYLGDDGKLRFRD